MTFHDFPWDMAGDISSDMPMKTRAFSKAPKGWVFEPGAHESSGRLEDLWTSQNHPKPWNFYGFVVYCKLFVVHCSLVNNCLLELMRFQICHKATYSILCDVLISPGVHMWSMFVCNQDVPSRRSDLLYSRNWCPYCCKHPTCYQQTLCAWYRRETKFLHHRRFKSTFCWKSR